MAHYCHQCKRNVSVHSSSGAVACERCNGGFVEKLSELDQHRNRLQNADRNRTVEDRSRSLSFGAPRHATNEESLQRSRARIARYNDAVAAGGSPRFDYLAAFSADTPGPIFAREIAQPYVTPPPLIPSREALDEALDEEFEGLRARINDIFGRTNEDHPGSILHAAHHHGRSNGSVQQNIAPPASVPSRHAANEESLQRSRARVARYNEAVAAGGMPRFDYLAAFSADIVHALPRLNGDEHQVIGISREVMERLPTAKVNSTQAKNEMECVTCMEEFALAEEVVRLGCRHIFHRDCIVPWLLTQNTCPLCRRQVDPTKWEAENESNKTIELE